MQVRRPGFGIEIFKNANEMDNFEIEKRYANKRPDCQTTAGCSLWRELDRKS